MAVKPERFPFVGFSDSGSLRIQNQDLNISKLELVDGAEVAWWERCYLQCLAAGNGTRVAYARADNAVRARRARLGKRYQDGPYR